MVLLTLGVIALVMAHLAWTERKDKSSWLALEATVAMLATGVVGIFLYISDNATQKHIQETQDQLVKTQIDLLVAQKEVQVKTENIENLNENIRNLITGGDSYFYLSFRNWPEGLLNKVTAIGLEHVGDYPLYDISIEVIDLNLFAEKHEKMPLHQARAESQREASLRMLTPDAPTNLSFRTSRRLFPELSDGSGRYHVLITAANGRHVQQVRFERVDSRWLHAHRVFRSNNRKEIMQEYTDAGFPRQNGRVVWWQSIPEAVAQIKASD